MKEPTAWSNSTSYNVNDVVSKTTNSIHKSYYVATISNSGQDPAAIENSDTTAVILNAWTQISIKQATSTVDIEVQRKDDAPGDQSIEPNPDVSDGTGAIIRWKRASGTESYSIRGFAILNGRKPI